MTATENPITLPSESYADATAAIAHAQERGLMLTVEMDPGAWDCNPEEAAATLEELAPGESFTVLALMSVEEYEAKQLREAEARRRADRIRQLRAAERQERARVRAQITDALTSRPLTEHADALAGFVMNMRRVADGATHLTCQEADAVAAVLNVIGCTDAAGTFLDYHAAGDDDPDDLHRDRETAPELSR